MWVLLVLGAIVAAVASRSPREAPSRRQFALPPPPGPIAVLGEIVRIGQVPPPTVILCAIAEAEAIGRDDLAADIIRVFVAPVVQQHAWVPSVPYAQAPYAVPPARTIPAAFVRESCATQAPSRSPRDRADAVRMPTVPASFAQQPPQSARSASYVPQPTVFAPQRVPAALGQRSVSDDEIRAMLNADPEGFIAMATRGLPAIDVPIDAVQPAIIHAMPPLMALEAPAPASPASPPSQDILTEQPQEPTGLPPEMVADLQEAAGLHEAADQTRALSPGSPLAGVSDDAWRTFVMRLEREAPQFSSSRHIGQYRQCRDRLRELGIDPKALADSAQAQRAALDADLVDAHQHAANGGLIDGHVRRAVAIPGRAGTETITLSGVLGVIQCAGLDGAVGWLEKPGDRKRFPYTTQMFLDTNKLF